ncbi:hypothetical protein KI387_012152, partial [Taxus chinensis]
KIFLTEVAGSKPREIANARIYSELYFPCGMLDLRIAMGKQERQFQNGELCSGTTGFRNKEIRSAEVAGSKLPKVSRSKFERACRDYKDGVVKPTERMFRLVRLRLCLKRRKCTGDGKNLAAEGKNSVGEGRSPVSEGKISAGDVKNFARDGKKLADGLRRSVKGDGIGHTVEQKIIEQVQEFAAEASDFGKKKKAKSVSPAISQSKGHFGAKVQEKIPKGEAEREIVKESKKPEKRKAPIKSSDEAKHVVKRQRLGKGNAQCREGVGSIEDRCANGEDREPKNNQRKRQKKQLSGNVDLEVVARKITGASNGDVSATMKLANPVNKEHLTSLRTSEVEVLRRGHSGKEAAKKTKARALTTTISVEEPEVRKTTPKVVKENGFLPKHRTEELKGMGATSNESKISEFYFNSQERKTSGHAGNSRPLGEDVTLIEVRKVADGLDDQKQEILTHDNINATDIPIIDGIIIDKSSPTSVLTEAEGNKDSKRLSTEPEKPPSAWVQCDKCTKWRQIPVELAEYIDITNPRWCCCDNLDKAFADCSIPQEKSDAEINAELNISESSNWNEIDNSDGQVDSKTFQKSHIEAAQQYVWTSIERNIYVNRCRKTPTIDEIMVCHCKFPEDGSPGCCGEDCLNRSMNIECVPGTCPCGDLCSNQRVYDFFLV